MRCSQIFKFQLLAFGILLGQYALNSERLLQVYPLFIFTTVLVLRWINPSDDIEFRDLFLAIFLALALMYNTIIFIRLILSELSWTKDMMSHHWFTEWNPSKFSWIEDWWSYLFTFYWGMNARYLRR